MWKIRNVRNAGTRGKRNEKGKKTGVKKGERRGRKTEGEEGRGKMVNGRKEITDRVRQIRNEREEKRGEMRGKKREG